MKEIKIIREGIYWTLYIDEEQKGCGYLEDIIQQIRIEALKMPIATRFLDMEKKEN